MRREQAEAIGLGLLFFAVFMVLPSVLIVAAFKTFS